MTESTGAWGEASVKGAKLFEGMIDSAMDAIVAADAQGQILAFNPAAETMFCVSAAEALGQSIELFIPRRFCADHQEHVARFARTGETHRRMGALGSVTAQRHDGEEFQAEASISKATVEGEEVFTVILREVAQRTKSEEAALLAREVDHRASNILATVSSLISLSAQSGDGKRSDGLAGRIDALARANSLLSIKRWRGAALTALVRDELRAQNRKGGFLIDGPDVMLSSRTVQPLGMLFHELADNAARHGALASADGEVSVRWHDTPDGKLCLVWEEQGGPAVTAPTRQGLGLTLAARILDAQPDATYRFDWHADGLRFEASLPASIRDCRRGAGTESAARTPAPSAEGPGAPPGADGSAKGRLLIVEDEQIIATQLARALASYGWTVTGVAGTLEAAFAALAKGNAPDIAILDVDLGGVAVFPFACALRQLGVPFLFCTGFDDVTYNREFLDCTVVRKPATVLQVVAALRTLAEAADAGAA